MIGKQKKKCKLGVKEEQIFCVLIKFVLQKFLFIKKKIENLLKKKDLQNFKCNINDLMSPSLLLFY